MHCLLTLGVAVGVSESATNSFCKLEPWVSRWALNMDRKVAVKNVIYVSYHRSHGGVYWGKRVGFGSPGPYENHESLSFFFSSI